MKQHIGFQIKQEKKTASSKASINFPNIVSGSHSTVSGGQYEPHVLALNGKVCSNVSVNQIPLKDRGERKLFIQLGTVMTDPEYRNRGLSRWLIEYIISQWKNRCDAIYLFANDSVLDFYPQFGFVQMTEFEYKRSGIKPNCTRVRKLNMSDENEMRFVLEKFEQGNPFSALSMIENQGLLSFYCLGCMKDNVFYSSKYDVVIIMEKENGVTRCCDIFGTTNSLLEEILGEISLSSDDEILLGFTPFDTGGFTCQKHLEEDTTLFVYGDFIGHFGDDKLMFPIISHA
jgi:GNAT superfamily N-acetyltransferase